jgi:hypothetical protein
MMSVLPPGRRQANQVLQEPSACSFVRKVGQHMDEVDGMERVYLRDTTGQALPE